MTGGTGFVGACCSRPWWTRTSDSASASAAVVTSRDPGLFRARQPHLGAGPVELVAADVRLPLPVAGSFDAVICAAAPASAAFNTDSPREMFETIVSGTSNTLDAAAPAGAVPFLLVSSGAVYGPQPPGVTHLAEDHLGGPDPLSPTLGVRRGQARRRDALRDGGGGRTPRDGRPVLQLRGSHPPREPPLRDRQLPRRRRSTAADRGRRRRNDRPIVDVHLGSDRVVVDDPPARHGRTSVQRRVPRMRRRSPTQRERSHHSHQRHRRSSSTGTLPPTAARPTTSRRPGGPRRSSTCTTPFHSLPRSNAPSTGCSPADIPCSEDTR